MNDVAHSVTSSESTKPSQPRNFPLVVALRWAAGGLLAVPVACLLHELAHYLVALALGFLAPTLHYFSSNYSQEMQILELMAHGDRAAVAAIYPAWKIALNAFAGPFASYILIVPAWICALRHKLPTFLVGLAALTFVRSVTETIFAIFSPQMLDDENVVAFAMRLPPSLLQVAGLAIITIAIVWLARRVPRDQRKPALLSMSVAIIAGLVAYLGFIGPWLLP